MPACFRKRQSVFRHVPAGSGYLELPRSLALPEHRRLSSNAVFASSLT